MAAGCTHTETHARPRNDGLTKLCTARFARPQYSLYFLHRQLLPSTHLLLLLHLPKPWLSSSSLTNTLIFLPLLFLFFPYLFPFLLLLLQVFTSLPLGALLPSSLPAPSLTPGSRLRQINIFATNILLLLPRLSISRPLIFCLAALTKGEDDSSIKW